ncbi:ras guanine nucleotide exchange factor domain-containing protein [Syncephalastrum racemosum]|uniref:Ras guanine nucleotide exchange factor domain-containing protein n=1 Tax=Syncephalastrum racemosum TaxID=13706 RepID=A0A1X2HPQ0_SYNRA|nr:ras guanine nucleotide exchange factor domain-containing protein [Syncephalastrum racemosum]
MIGKERPASPWTRTMDRIHYQRGGDSASSISSHKLVSRGTVAAPARPENGDEENDPRYITATAVTTQMPLPQETAIPGPRRKRNNSLIPPELMNDNSEGGRERAALATVFGVREYTESKIFWERQVSHYYDHAGLGTGSRQDLLDNEDGFVSITGRSVVSTPVGHFRSESAALSDTYPQSRDIHYVVDSALDQVGSDTTKSTMLKLPPRQNMPAADQASPFTLPEIPVVSKFSDLILDNSNTASDDYWMRPERPLSFASSSVDKPPTLYEYPPSITASEAYAGPDIAPPLLFIGYPPAIFDLLRSDEDERIIVWGLDPQVLSASMATTAAAGQASARRNTPSSPPPNIASAASTTVSSTATFRGFSSNTTSATPASPILPKQSTADAMLSKSSLRRSPRPGSRMSGLLSSRHTDTPDPDDTKGLFRFTRRNSRREKVAEEDSASIKTVDIPKVIEAATVEKLVEKLTVSLDYTFMTDFFLTYRTFISPSQLCNLLILRFRWGMETDSEERRIVRIRTFVVMRHWLLNYFVHDFIPCRELRVILTSFLNSLPFHPLVKHSPRDQRIVKSLKRVVRRLKKVYYVSSSTSERVKVIPPPPPTEDQERVEEMVRAKLAQSPMRRKTDLVSSVDVSDRHHGNMAVQDTRSAPVVVVGSVRTPRGTPVEGGEMRGPSNEAKRSNLSSVSLARLGSRSQLKQEAVKQSYMRRMEQQKRYMLNDGKKYSSSTIAQSINDNAEAGEGDMGGEASNRSSMISDNSLESALSPGTTDAETDSEDEDEDEEDEGDGEDEEEDGDRDTGNDSVTVNPPQKEQFNDERLTARLERERRRLEEEEEQRRAAFFSNKTDGADKTRRLSAPTVDGNKARKNGFKKQQSFDSGFDKTSSKGISLRSLKQRSGSRSSSHAPVHPTDACFGETNTPVQPSVTSSGDLPRMVELDIPREQQASSIAGTPAMYPLPFILYFRSDRMARQFCLIEAQVLLNIDWEEMVHCRWTKMSTQPFTRGNGAVGEEGEESFSIDYATDEEDEVNYTRRMRQKQLARQEHEGGVEQVINRFNAVCQWVASEIVRTRYLDDRVRVVEKFIRLAQKCKVYCNFATLVQILLGLQSPAVSRLQKTWSRVGTTEMRLLDQLSVFTSPMKNWKHIRDSMTQVAEEYGMSPVEVQIEMPGTNHHAFSKTKIKIPFGGCIPFLGIYLSDLVFNSEQPPYIQPNLENHRIYHANTRTYTDSISPVLLQPLVNFRKHRITATVIKRVLTFQNLARRYSFDRDDEVQYLCNEVVSFDAEEIRRMSLEREPAA